MLQSMGSYRGGYDSVTEQQQQRLSLRPSGMYHFHQWAYAGSNSHSTALNFHGTFNYIHHLYLSCSKRAEVKNLFYYLHFF